MSEEERLSKEYLSGYGFEIKSVIDVGVAFGTPWLYTAFPEASVALVDPLESSKDVLKRLLTQGREAELFFGVAGSQSGELILTRSITRPGRSSLHERTSLTKADDETVQETVACKTLDDIMAGMNLSGPFGLKIDTEGHENHVLEGAVNTLSDCTFVLMEISLRARFEEGYKPSDIFLFLRNHGFELIDIMSNKKYPRFIDVLFTRTAPSSHQLQL